MRCLGYYYTYTYTYTYSPTLSLTYRYLQQDMILLNWRKWLTYHPLQLHCFKQRNQEKERKKRYLVTKGTTTDLSTYLITYQRYYLLLNTVSPTWPVQPNLPTITPSDRVSSSRVIGAEETEREQNSRTNLSSPSPLDLVQDHVRIRTRKKFSLPELLYGLAFCLDISYAIGGKEGRSTRNEDWCGYCGWEEKVIILG